MALPERSERVTNHGWRFVITVVGDRWISKKTRDSLVEKVQGKRTYGERQSSKSEEGKEGGMGREGKGALAV